jgi:hypothetical protein
MNWILFLILLTGFIRLFTAISLAKIAWRTRNNPHPVGKTIMPEFVAVLCLIFANDALRGISFAISSEPLHAFVAEQGIWNLVFSNVLTLLLCVIVFVRAKRVEYEFTSTLR